MNPVVNSPSAEALSTIQGLHAQVQQKRTHTMPKRWDKNYAKALEAQPELLKRLTVTTSPDRLKEIFEKYEIIVLREPTPADEELLFFCGNEPIHSSAMEFSYDSEKRIRHAHPKTFTVDCDPLMNPSIIAEWPSQGAIAYLKERGCRFKQISGESMPLTHTFLNTINDLQTTLKALTDLLAEGGVVKTDWDLHVNANDEFTEVRGELLGMHEHPLTWVMWSSTKHPQHRYGDFFKETITEKALTTIKELTRSNHLDCDIQIGDSSSRNVGNLNFVFTLPFKFSFTKKAASSQP